MSINHPCYTGGCYQNIVRIHLPVADVCNLGCGFCERSIENKDGIKSSNNAVSPQTALSWLKKLIEEDKEDIKVVGIAGPGEPLFSENTFETLKLVKESYPEISTCLCTNGVNLDETVDRITGLLDYLTVTINAYTPETAKKIYKFVVFNGEYEYGLDSFQKMLDKKWEGVKKALASNSFNALKINSIFIPDVNDEEIVDIAKKAGELGIDELNIKTLIPKAYFKDHKKFKKENLKKVREEAGKYITVFKECKNCSYDAVGVPGKDRRLNLMFKDEI